MDTLALRLHPGQDLKIELDSFIEKQGIEAACIITCLGSLTTAVLRFANQATCARLEGHFEIISVSGVLAKHGSHCHICIADEKGRVYGAHLMDGCKVYTTVEIVLGIIPNHSFFRKLDPLTGYPELEVVSHHNKGASHHES